VLFASILNYRLFLASRRSYAFPSLNQFKHGESIPVVAFFCHYWDALRPYCVYGQGRMQYSF